MSFLRGAIAGCAVFSAVLTTVPVSHAAPLFQSIPNLVADTITSPWCSSCTGSYRIFDTFSLGSSSSVGSVTVSLYDEFPYFPTTFEISVWSINAGLPDDQLFAQTFAPADFVSVVHTGDSRAIVTVNPVGLSLLAGTYDISFHAYNLAVWGYVGGGGLLYQQDNVFHTGTSAGFILNGDSVGTVPVPAALPLFASGLGLLGFAGWRRKRRAAA